MQMRIDNFSGKFGLVIVTAKPGTHFPQYDRDEKQRRRGSQPMPKERPRRGSGGRDWAEMGVNRPPQRGGGRLIKLSELQSAAQPIQVHELSGAVDAMPEVALEFGSARGVQFTVEIALKEGIAKVTLHGQPPFERSLPARNATGGAKGEVRAYMCQW